MLPSINSTELIKLLEEQLKQLEDMQGGEVDAEARQKLHEFKLAAAAAASASNPAPVTTDDQIVDQLQSVAEQLDDVEKDLAKMDPAARKLLEASASTWLHPEIANVLTASQAANKQDTQPS